MLKKVIFNQLFDIYHGSRIICRFNILPFLYSVEKNNKIDEKLLKITTISIHNDVKLYTVPYYILLIELYNDLYNPLYYSTWKDIHNNIKILEPMHKKQITEIKTQWKPNINKETTKETEGGSIFENKDFFNENIIEFIKSYEYVILFNNLDVMELIINVDINSFIEQLKLYFSRTNNNNFIIEPELFTFNEQMIYTVKEDFIRCYNIYIGGKDNKKLIVYNNTNFELVSVYKQNNMYYADPIVQNRFLYLRLFNMIINIKSFNKFYLELNKILDVIEENSKLINIKEKKIYKGIYIDVKTYKKILLKEEKQVVKNLKKHFYCIDFNKE